MRNSRKWIPLLLIFVICLSFALPAAAAGVRTAVIEFDVLGEMDNRDAGRMVAEWMLTGLAKEGKFDLKAREVLLKKVLQEQALSASGVIDNQTAVEIGKVYGVENIVTGSISKWGDVIKIDARLIDTQNGTILRADGVQVGTTAEIPDGVQSLAALLSGREVSPQLKSNVTPLVEPQSGYRLTQIRFYETPYDILPFKDRLYTERFLRAKTRFVGTEIRYDNPYFNLKDSAFEVTFEYLKDSGERVGRLSTVATPKKDWEWAYLTDSLGWKQPGQWTEGSYTVKVYFNGAFVGKAKFRVY